MVNICQTFAAERNLKFGTNPDPKKAKTKCIVFAKKMKAGPNLANIKLNGVDLPWVTQVKHLGHTLQSDNTMKVDMAIKRGAFIGKVNSLLQEFHAVPSEVFLKILNVYATSLYGSNTWNILSTDCERLYSSFNVTIRKALNIDRCTHRYLLEPLAGCLHLKVMLASRYATFYKSLISCRKTAVRFMARLAAEDQRTVLGSTLTKLMMKCDINTDADGALEKLTPGLIKQRMSYAIVPEQELWRMSIGQEFLKICDGCGTSLPGFTKTEVEDILKFVCSS